jgi:ketosteroid isomerase-like protein
MKNLAFIILVLTILSCSHSKSDNMEQAKKEIVSAEKNFALMVKQKGIAEGFYFYAADSAIVNRNIKLITGKDSIKAYYQKWPYAKVELIWEPDYVDISQSCDLGYTYGKFTFLAIDSTGKRHSSKGYFHTVWKKQNNGEWKFVWD